MMIYKILLIVLLIYLLYYIIKKYLESYNSTEGIELFYDSDNNYYDLLLTDENNIIYRLISLSQLNAIYIKKILQYMLTNHNTNLEILFKNMDDSINDITNIINYLKINETYVPFNDVLFAITELTLMHLLLPFKIC